MSRSRLLAIAVGASVLLASIGLAWDAARFGWSQENPDAHLRNEITRLVADRARLVQTTAERVSRMSDLVAAAIASRDRLPDLFTRLDDPGAAETESVSATIWVPSSPAADYRALAWTDGPAENLKTGYLNRAPGLFVISGAGGLRLIYVQPIDRNGDRLAVVAAETPLSSPNASRAPAPAFSMPSSVGPVQVESLEATRPTDELGRFTVSSPAGMPLLVVHISPEQMSRSRREFHWRVAAVSLIPWGVVLLIAITAMEDRRRSTARLSAWLAWTIAIGVGILGAVLAASLLIRESGWPTVIRDDLVALGALALVATGPTAAWTLTRPLRSRPGIRYVSENLFGGVVLGAVFVATVWLWQTRISTTSMEPWQLPALPSSARTAAGLASVLITQLAVAWSAAATLGILAARWRLSWRRGRAWVAILLWLIPGAVLLSTTWTRFAWPPLGIASLAVSAAVFGLAATSLRRQFRHTSEARRLVLQFFALLAPLLAVYPVAAAAADGATRQIIEREYSPATQAAKQPEQLMASLTEASADIDKIRELPEQLREAGTSVNSTQLAYNVWSRSALSRNRVSSQLELYGPARNLVSWFALNVPEFGAPARAGEQMWRGHGCEWDAFAEVARFGAGERLMLHAERALCGAGGEFLGAVVIRLIPDYRTLSFVTSANPYYDALGSRDPQGAGTRVSELQVVVYGWGLRPAFVSGRVIWPIDGELFDRLYTSRQPFWLDRELDDRIYHVYFSSDRGGIYALGYPAPTPLQHATRLAESGALLMLLFVIYLAATVVLAPLVQRRITPLGRLFTEIRASFYRKLFLFFVVAAVGPVVLFAIAFGTYMTTKLRADVESEASSVVLMARRVLDELSAAQTPVGQTRPAPDDDVMVWIRQVVDQDVNLFEGSELRATSQRDLFDSGLLPTRTPASAYKEVVLDRRAVSVAPDRIGAFSYQVAAAAVPALGREVLLTVPLASRQREIDRQIDELTQGVLTGTVVLVLFAAALGASVAARVSDPVARLTRATRLVAAGRYDERLTADTADELGRLVDDFNTMTEMLVAQRAELARANQLKAWAEMARQVAHEIKNPLTPIQLAAEHLQRVHEDANRPMGGVVDQCVSTILRQVRLLRQIASEFSTFAGAPSPRFEAVNIATVVNTVVEPYRQSLPSHTRITLQVPASLPSIRSDRTLLSRALTNLVENAVQAMPNGGTLSVDAARTAEGIEIRFADTGVGMDPEAVQRAFEPYFSTKTAGSGLGLANAKRNIEICGGRIDLTSQPGGGTTVTVTVPVDRPAAP